MVSSASSEKGAKRRVLILLSDTGGGHRASARAISDALEEVYGLDTLDISILDLWTTYGSWPFNAFVPIYRFASENPWCWKVMYESSQSPISRSLFLSSGYAVSATSFARVFSALKPDLIISVHPLCQHVPLQILHELNCTGLPFVTVVTDLGGAHPTWFHPKATRIYLPSRAVKEVALGEGILESNIRQFGLPLRRDFWRSVSPRDKPQSQTAVREMLGLCPDWPTALLVGGGEGVGNIDLIASSVVETFLAEPRSLRLKVVSTAKHRISEVDRLFESDNEDRDKPLQIVIVCGKNEQLRERVLTELRSKLQSDKVILSDYGAPLNPSTGVKKAARKLSHGSSPSRYRSVSTSAGSPERSTSSPSLVDGLRAGQPVIGESDRRYVYPYTNRVRALSHVNLSPGSRSDPVLPLSPPLSDEPSTLRRCASEDCATLRALMAQMEGDPWSGAELDQYSSSIPKVDAAVSKPEEVPPANSKLLQRHRNECEAFMQRHQEKPFKVRIVVYGFTNQMHDLMTASDLLISKAGPGTIAEATTRSLPVVLSSYLPGQEEGNVSYVLENQFGTFCTDYHMIGVIVRTWLTNRRFRIKLRNMSMRSYGASNPTASLQIAEDLSDLLNLQPQKAST